jgi:hypothetical protein
MVPELLQFRHEGADEESAGACIEQPDGDMPLRRRTTWQNNRRAAEKCKEVSPLHARHRSRVSADLKSVAALRTAVRRKIAQAALSWAGSHFGQAGNTLAGG